MSTNTSILWSPAPYHIISYSTLLGASLYQSFVVGIVSYRALPRPQFSLLQEKIFPVFFPLQTALPVLMALTYPARSAALSPVGASVGAGGSGGIVGVLEAGNRWTVAAPIGLVLCCNAFNMLVAGPVAARIMRERKRQEVVDGKKSRDEGTKSREMEDLIQRFGRWHGASMLVNLVGMGATVWYGILLAGRLT